MKQQPTYAIDKIIKYRVFKGDEEVYLSWENYKDKTWEPITSLITPDQDTIQAIAAMRQKYKQVKKRLAKEGTIIQDLQVANPNIEGGHKLQRKIQKNYFKMSQLSEWSEEQEESDRSFTGRRHKNKIKRSKNEKESLQSEIKIKQSAEIIAKKRRGRCKKQPEEAIKDQTNLKFRIRLRQLQPKQLEKQVRLPQELSPYSEYFEEKREQLPNVLECLKGLTSNVNRVKGSLRLKGEMYYEAYFGVPQAQYPIILHQSYITHICPQIMAQLFVANIK